LPQTAAETERSRSRLADYLVMADRTIVFDHHRAHVLRDHRVLGVRSGECSDRRERLPLGDDEKFHADGDVAPENRGTLEARDPAQRRKGFGLQVLHVRRGVLPLRQTAPLARDHRPGSVSVFDCTARASAARASRRVESSVGSAEFVSPMMSGISGPPRTTASHPFCFMRWITLWNEATPSGLKTP